MIWNFGMLEYFNFGIFEYWKIGIIGFLNFWIFDFWIFEFWIFEFLNFWIFQFLNFWIFEFFEFFNFGIFGIFESSNRVLLYESRLSTNFVGTYAGWWDIVPFPAFEYHSYLFFHDYLSIPLPSGPLSVRKTFIH